MGFFFKIKTQAIAPLRDWKRLSRFNSKISSKTLNLFISIKKIKRIKSTLEVNHIATTNFVKNQQFLSLGMFFQRKTI